MLGPPSSKRMYALTSNQAGIAWCVSGTTLHAGAESAAVMLLCACLPIMPLGTPPTGSICLVCMLH
jgi:hypothetical protein